MTEQIDTATADVDEVAVGQRKRRKKTPLYQRIFSDERLIALVRLFGHDGMPLDEVPLKAKPLLEKFGKEHLQEAADEIIEIVGEGDDAVARLTEEAQRLAIQLLGRPRTVDPQKPDDAQSNNTQSSREVALAQDPTTTPANTATTPTESGPSPTIEASSPEAIREDETPDEPPAISPCDEISADAHDWANYETACVAAFLNGDREFLDECLHLVEACREDVARSESENSNDQTITETQASRLADQLQRLVCEYNPLADEETIFAKLLDAALSNVDWRDLADSFLSRSTERSAEQ